MWEDTFQVFKKFGIKREHESLVASDMSIRDATLFVIAWFEENFNDQYTSIEIRRQPKDYSSAKVEGEA